MKRSAALWLQPKHLRSVARNADSVETLHAVCELVINGQVPELAKQWLYVHKVVALSKLSSHQKDIEERLQAQAAGNGDDYIAQRQFHSPLSCRCRRRGYLPAVGVGRVGPQPRRQPPRGHGVVGGSEMRCSG